MTKGDETAYVANRFALEFDHKKQSGFVSAIDGAHFKSNPIKTMVGNSNYVAVYSGKPQYDETTITVGMAMSPTFWEWINASLDNKPQRRNGALVGYDFNMLERSRRTFYRALISQVKFPALDPTVKTPAGFEVTFSPERLEFEKGDNSKLTPTTALNETSKQKRWLCSNFRFELDRFRGDESLTTLSMQGFTVKQNIIPQNIGYELESRKPVGRLGLPQLVVAMPRHKCSEWHKWYETAIVKGDRRGQSTTGVLTYFSTDKQELMRVEFDGVSLAGLEVDKYDATKKQIANITATLNIERMKLVPGKGNA